MKLSVLERLVLPNLLPAPGSFEGTIANARALRKLREDLAFDEDGKTIGLKEEKGKIIWDASKAVDKEVYVPEPIVEYVINKLKELEQDGDGHITENHITLWDKLIGTE